MILIITQVKSWYADNMRCLIINATQKPQFSKLINNIQHEHVMSMDPYIEI